MENELDNPGVIAPPPLIYLSGLVAGSYLQSQLPVPWLPRPIRTFLGGALIGGAIPLGMMALRGMRGASTNVNPTQPTTALVVEGPFRLTRNPLYLGVSMLYTGIAALTGSLWAILLLPVILCVMTRGVIEREERYPGKQVRRAVYAV